MVESISTFFETLLHTDVVVLSAFAVWCATFLAGENGALLSLMFALQGFLPLHIALVFSFLGSLSADLFWYGMTTGAIRPWVERRFKKHLTQESAHTPLFSVANTHPYIVLLFIKFLVGIRLILTIYIVAKRRIPFYTYLACNVVANILFIAGLFALVWSFNEGAEFAVQAEQRVTHILTILTIVSVGGNIVLRGIQYGVLRLLQHHKNSETRV